MNLELLVVVVATTLNFQYLTLNFDACAGIPKHKSQTSLFE